MKKHLKTQKGLSDLSKLAAEPRFQMVLRLQNSCFISPTQHHPSDTGVGDPLGQDPQLYHSPEAQLLLVKGVIQDQSLCLNSAPASSRHRQAHTYSTFAPPPTPSSFLHWPLLPRAAHCSAPQMPGLPHTHPLKLPRAPSSGPPAPVTYTEVVQCPSPLLDWHCQRAEMKMCISLHSTQFGDWHIADGSSESGVSTGESWTKSPSSLSLNCPPNKMFTTLQGGLLVPPVNIHRQLSLQVKKVRLLQRRLH